MKKLRELMMEARNNPTNGEFLCFFPGGTHRCRWIDPWLGAFEVLADGLIGRAVYVHQFESVEGIYVS